jgi:voltage-gated potassium channel
VFRPQLAPYLRTGRIQHARHNIRAAWHDTRALLREFRRSILIFLLAILGGGYLYGQLGLWAGNPRIPYVELPYLMLALMVLNQPMDMPPQPYLMAFWYLMPLVGAYIIGRGAVDFVRLFFNRQARRRSWEEAVASTYINHVIVLGVGHVGLRVARSLVQMGFEVVAIEVELGQDQESELKRLGVPVIVSDGRSVDALIKAGLREAQSLVVCTADDHVNLEATLRARDLNPDVRIVVRMWDDRYSQQLKRFLGVRSVMSASELSAPAFAGAAVGIEVTQTLHIHGVDYSLIRLRVEQGSFLDGGTIGFLQDHYKMDIVLHGKDEEVCVHPAADKRVGAGDMLVIFGKHDRIIDIVNRNRPHSKQATLS